MRSLHVATCMSRWLFELPEPIQQNECTSVGSFILLLAPCWEFSAQHHGQCCKAYILLCVALCTGVGVPLETVAGVGLWLEVRASWNYLAAACLHSDTSYHSPFRHRGRCSYCSTSLSTLGFVKRQQLLLGIPCGLFGGQGMPGIDHGARQVI